jgi:hypothetical protein
VFRKQGDKVAGLYVPSEVEDFGDCLIDNVIDFEFSAD